MTDTDRKKIKDEQEGVFLGLAGVADAHLATRDLHSITRDYTKATTENAITASAALVPGLASVQRKSRLRDIGIYVTTNIAQNTANYAVINFYKRTAGTSTLIGSWNTGATTQGALTTNIAGHVTTAVGLITNSDADIAAGSSLVWNIAKTGTGQLVDVGTVFSFDLEAI